MRENPPTSVGSLSLKLSEAYFEVCLIFLIFEILYDNFNFFRYAIFITHSLQSHPLHYWCQVAIPFEFRLCIRRHLYQSLYIYNPIFISYTNKSPICKHCGLFYACIDCNLICNIRVIPYFLDYKFPYPIFLIQHILADLECLNCYLLSACSFLNLL